MFVFDDFGLLFNLKRTVQGKTVDYNTEQNRKIYRIDPGACILLLTELIVIDVPKVQYVEHGQCRFVFFKTLVHLPLYLQVKRVFYMLRTCSLVSAC